MHLKKKWGQQHEVQSGAQCKKGGRGAELPAYRISARAIMALDISQEPFNRLLYQLCTFSSNPASLTPFPTSLPKN